jgi:hypothetical protein
MFTHPTFKRPCYIKLFSQIEYHYNSYGAKLLEKKSKKKHIDWTKKLFNFYEFFKFQTHS